MKDSIQLRLFEKILDHFPRKAQAVEELETLLNVGKDAVYRRLRGDTLLTPDEMRVLARKFSISLDELAFEGADVVFVSFNAFQQQAQGFYEFMEGILKQTQMVQALPDAQIYYATHEIPVFHYMYYPELISFKLYVWGRTSWNLKYLQEKSFSFDLVPFPITEMTEKILNFYNQIPTTELWSLGIVDTTLNQIEYVATIDKFQNDQDALLLCDRLLEMVQHMRSMAEQGKKFAVGGKADSKSGIFNLYHNELVSTNNTLLINAPVGKYLITTFCNPNFFRSADEKLCNFTEEWLKTLISNSTGISTHSGKSRNWFFNRLEKKIRSAKTRIEMILEGEL